MTGMFPRRLRLAPLALAWAAAVLLVVGCARGDGEDTRGRGGNTLRGSGLTGTLRIVVAEPLRPIVDRQVRMFRQSYPDAEITVTSATTREAYVAFVRARADAIVVDREPNPEEVSALKRTGARWNEVEIGRGALVAAVHPSNGVRVVTPDVLGRVAAGQPVPWAEVGEGGPSGYVRLALAPLNVGVTELLARRVLPRDSLPRPAFAAESEADALRWLGENPGGLAVVSLAAYTAVSDSVARALAVPDSTGQPIPPAPRRVYVGQYPLRHPIVLLVSPRSRALGAGFATFARGVQGQEAVQRAGLVPAVLPAREIELQ